METLIDTTHNEVAETDYLVLIQEKLSHIPLNYLAHLYELVALMAKPFEEEEKLNKTVLQQYTEEVRTGFEFYFNENFALNAQYQIDDDWAYIYFSVVKLADFVSEIQLAEQTLAELLSNNQLETSKIGSQLDEKGKAKLYDENGFCIIRFAEVADWSLEKAKEDAREEIGLFLQKLPNTQEANVAIQ